jgi:hypothetical protein
MRAPILLRVAAVAVALASAAPALASAISSSNLFPDPFGIYYNTNTGVYITPSGVVTLEGLVLSSPAASIAPPAPPAAAVWGVGSSFTGAAKMSFFGGPTVSSTNPGDLASARITGLLDAPPLHTYSTEMLSLSLVGLPSGARIRESPTLASTGGHTITDTAPGGPYKIDSFFDVFTELSLDGGTTWTPATGPVHLVNPEPGSLALVGCAAVLLICRRRRLAVHVNGGLAIRPRV